MAKKKRKVYSSDRHTSGFMLRLPETYRTQVNLLRLRTSRSITEEVRTALEAHLASHGLWPPGTPPLEQPGKS